MRRPKCIGSHENQYIQSKQLADEHGFLATLRMAIAMCE